MLHGWQISATESLTQAFYSELDSIVESEDFSDDEDNLDLDSLVDDGWIDAGDEVGEVDTSILTSQNSDRYRDIVVEVLTQLRETASQILMEFGSGSVLTKLFEQARLPMRTGWTHIFRNIDPVVCANSLFIPNILPGIMCDRRTRPHPFQLL